MYSQGHIVILLYCLTSSILMTGIQPNYTIFTQFCLNFTQDLSPPAVRETLTLVSVKSFQIVQNIDWYWLNYICMQIFNISIQHSNEAMCI